VLDERTPVLVGADQLARHLSPERLAETATEPADMAAEVARGAEVDAGGHGLLSRATGLWVVDAMGWRYRDPCTPIAERLGIAPKHLLRSGVGGDSPTLLLNRAAGAIQAGEHDVVLICGAEAVRSRRLARRHDVTLDWTSQPETMAEPELLAPDKVGLDPVHPGEHAVGLGLPVQYYPMFENAVRARLGRGLAEHTRVIAQLWSRFSEVGATNPHAWRPTAYTADQIADPGPDNRMVGTPYTKLMNADIGVDMAAALVVCSVAAARAAGIPADRWVFPLAGAGSHDHWFVGERADLGDSPAIRANGRAALTAAGLGIDEIAHLDLYSCFPCAVEVAADAMGLRIDDPGRPLTVTGGLTFAGGPGNNYVTHALAAMLGRLRSDSGANGLVTGNGYYLTKHALTVLGTREPQRPFRYLNSQPEVDGLPRVTVRTDYHGAARCETYTVLHGSDGTPDYALMACRAPDGQRVWARGDEPGLLEALTSGDPLGQTFEVAGSELRMP
jgi:acetyl-CoA C-acetyltransferase